MRQNAIPMATLGRLPEYLQYLKSLPCREGATISAAGIARGLSLGEVQVRKDLAAVSGSGRPKIGYITADLIEELEQCLGGCSMTSAILVGAGKLGRALLEFNGFEDYGVRIAAAFDSNEQIIQHSKHTKEILPIHALEAFCKDNRIQLGIITVGQGSAQWVCDRMVACGIRAIWNFAPCRLDVPDGILLKQENLALSLAHLNNQLQKQTDKGTQI